MIVVSDASPLITLARIDCFQLLPNLYTNIYLSLEVYQEVVVNGAGLPGADEVSRCEWISVRHVRNAAALAAVIADTGLGAGEIGTVILAKELSADLVLMDERKARHYAQQEGLAVIGCVGILEKLYEGRHLSSLREVYRRLVKHRMRIDLDTLQRSLDRFELPRL